MCFAAAAFFFFILSNTVNGWIPESSYPQMPSKEACQIVWLRSNLKVEMYNK